MADEWLTAEREHEYKMAELAAQQADEDRRARRWQREERTKRVGYVVAGLTIAAIILGIGWFIWSGTNDGRASLERKEVACIEQGGTWTSIGGANSRKGCYRIGEVE